VRRPCSWVARISNTNRKTLNMGQAKRRGTFDDRRILAIQRDQEAARQRMEKRREEQAAEDARIDAMSEEERDAYYSRRSRRNSVMPLVMMAALAMPLATLGGFGRRPR
jgi:hypothetical protein